MKAFLIGLGIGVGIGILIAPSSGEITREKVQDSIAKAADSVKDELDEAKSRMQARSPGSVSQSGDAEAGTG